MTERFSLPARNDTSAADTLVQALLLRRGEALEIDASGVEVIGALALEVIIAGGKQWMVDGLPLTIVGPSDRFRMTCDTLGLRADAPWLPKDAAQPGVEAVA